MEFPIGNIVGDFDQVDINCPRCGSSQVIAEANQQGYFEVSECRKCGFKNTNRI